MDSFLKILLSMQFISLVVVCSPVLLSIDSATLSSSSLSSDLESSTSFEYPSTTPSPSTESTIAPIVFSHDPNPFDPTSVSFGENSNWNITKPMPIANATTFNGSPIAPWANVIPLPKFVSGHRQERVLLFRPIFVYRQQQAMKHRQTVKLPLDPDRFYPQYHYHYPPYPLPPYGTDLYGSHFPELVPNDISVPSPASGWFGSNANYAWHPQHPFGFLQ